MTTLAVADGVGGWADSGVDPSVFSQALMYYSFKASAPPSQDSTQPRLRPSQIMQKGYDGVLEENEVKAGELRNEIDSFPSFVLGELRAD